MKVQLKTQALRSTLRSWKKSLLLSCGLLTALLMPFAVSVPARALNNVIADGNLGEYASANTAPVLSLGTVSPVVADVQFFLSDQGFYEGAADSVYGDATFDAVVSFQQAQGITADGVIGSETWSALFAIDDRIASIQ
ncbi:MAG: peptidoglycan-binding protein [Oculatellaceae cyanobacterium Prado106]|jgi:peptidoglycan hydrolase-like protein with peptidoglycan-binding domain|nr:peptidoglycan-binding protein [Oculatellaceae cyanobacterium Prado106]